MNICGFLVVRKASENYQLNGRGVWPYRPPQIDNLYYHGVWRMPWCDVAFDLQDGILPDDLRELFLTNVPRDENSGLACCRDLEVARTLLKYCNRDKVRCELIAVHSQAMASVTSTLDVPDDILRQLGWEPFQIGGSSLLDNGIFVVPSVFTGWRDKLNENGLLVSLEAAQEYSLEYLRLVETGSLEELFPLEDYPIDPIQVFTLKI